MPQYIYLPIGNGEQMDMANAINAQCKSQGLDEWAIIANTSTGFLKAGRRIFSGKLDSVNQADPLMILLHGSGNDVDRANTLGADRNLPHAVMDDGTGQQVYFDFGTMAATANVHAVAEMWKSYTPERLARHMKKEGLKKTHRLIKLSACNSGKEHNASSFASDFRVAMRALGYLNLSVDGYIGELMHGNPGSSDGRLTAIPDGSGGELMRRASMSKIRY